MNSSDLAPLLPDVSAVRNRSRALAMIEAIVSPEWENRYYSFNAAWSDQEQMASMRNGSGDAYPIVFGPSGAFIRGFDHESTMSPARTGELWPGLADAVPAVFLAQVDEPAFSYDGLLEATFCLWRQTEDVGWQTGTIDFPDYDGNRTSPDGSEMHTILCDPTPDTYLAFAADYYEITLNSDAAAALWPLQPLHEGIVAALNPRRNMVDLQDDINEIDYPVA